MQIREAKDGDMPLIFSTWVNGAYFGSDKPKDEATERQEKYKLRCRIERILDSRSTHVVIACDKKDPDFIYGYSVFENKDQGATLHWIFVKPTFRRFGIGRNITPETIDEVSHLTTFAKKIKPDLWKYNPFK